MQNPPINWQLLALDSFDRSSPPQIDKKGTGLISALFHLWEKTIAEGLTDTGKKTLTSFQLEINPQDLSKHLPHLSPLDAHIDLTNTTALKNLRSHWQNTLAPESFIGQLVEITIKALQSDKNKLTIQQCSLEILNFLEREN